MEKNDGVETADPLPREPSAPVGVTRLATASFALGVVSFLGLGPLASIPGLLSGYLSQSKLVSPDRRQAGLKIANRGIALCYVNIFLVMTLVILLPAVAHDNPNRRRASCQNNLKQFGVVFKMFASDNKDFFPQLSAEKGQLMFTNPPHSPQAVFPEYFTDPTIFVCQDEPNADERRKALDTAESDPPTNFHPDPKLFINDSSYVYLGYDVTNDAELKAFANAYKEHVARGLPFDSDLEVSPGTGSAGGDTIRRLKDGVERFIITDIDSAETNPRTQLAIPVMWDRCHYDPNAKPGNWFNHKPAGANVLFSDGHVEFVKYPGKFPVTENACRILEELEALRAQ